MFKKLFLRPHIIIQTLISPHYCQHLAASTKNCENLKFDFFHSSFAKTDSQTTFVKTAKTFERSILKVEVYLLATLTNRSQKTLTYFVRVRASLYLVGVSDSRVVQRHFSSKLPRVRSSVAAKSFCV